MACMASILFSNSDFSSMGGPEKGVYQTKLGNGDCRNCENCGQGGEKLDSGEVNPH